MNVCAVIVTHNRSELLAECLRAVVSQTHPLDAVLVVDNASTDGTREMVRRDFPALELLALERNDGSSGGFHDGMQRAMGQGHDWLWVMDDDTIPRPDALERLVARTGARDGLPEPVLLVSKILWTDGAMHPMNLPGLGLASVDAFVRSLESGLLKIRAATFPCMLVSTDAIRRHGLPRRDFFIWSDDIEFSLRILRDETGYLVPDSVAVHKTPTPHRPAEGGRRFYFAVRNGIATVRSEGLRPREKLMYSALVADQVREFVQRERYRPWALALVARGVRDGLRMPRRQR